MKQLIFAGLLVGASVLPAYAQSCGELWYERNAIYKDAGYCFKT
ncbi:MAG TPA: YARHG domain-containing protein, partial [Beijerinckiaceae bacterium]|nr:YARHG domain-containing protein [Beijerinckiaceae bacterium]